MANECPKCQTNNPDTVKFCGECGTQLSSAEKGRVSITKTLVTPSKGIIPGTTFASRYEIIEELGRGGMGVVYKAEDTKLKRTVAIKLLPTQLTGDKEAKERFIREAQSAAMLDHPNICTIYEVDESEGKPFISMAYVDGQNLQERIKANPLDVNEGLEIAIQAVEGVSAAHNKDIIHRDIKSANIMVTKLGQAKIMDFGLAKLVGASLITREGVTMGTVAYMSPEQARGETVDHRSDIWSLGVVIYEMLSGQLPFKGDHEASILYSVVHEEPRRLKDIKPDIPLEVEQIISRALKKNPESRYSSSAEMLKDLKAYLTHLRSPEVGITDFKSLVRHIRKPRIAISTILITLLLCSIAVWFFSRSTKIRWAREKAIPEIEKFIENDDYTGAFKLALEAEKFIPKDSRLIELLPKIERSFSVQTTPPGANVYIKDYRATESDWEYLGRSPINNARISSVFKRWIVTKEGYETIEGTDEFDETDFWERVYDVRLDLVLERTGVVPPDMNLINGKETEIGEIDDFYMDKYEVTNKEYKEFVDSGGYSNREYWKNKFIQDGHDLAWEDAMKEFIDSTGRPGPSTWEVGDYPEGEDDLPVSGVSWYEAAAYAEFIGKSLPTVYHWKVAATLINSSRILPLSNFTMQSIAPVGKYQGISSTGIYDMGGNVKEWCWNESGNKRFILGGAWNEPNYMFLEQEKQSPFLRSDNLGFRCMKYIPDNQILQAALDPIKETLSRDFVREKPCPDEIFQIYKSLFSYDKTELKPVVESIDETPKDWITEKVSFNAAYGNERMIAYIFLPKNSAPPYQTVIHFPGVSAFWLTSIEDYPKVGIIDIFVKSGRACIFPVYKGAFERGPCPDSIRKWPSSRTWGSTYKDHMIMWSKDLGRTIDYLESRQEFDIQKLAYYGLSGGACHGAVLPAVEDRFKAVIMLGGGFYNIICPSEVDQINFAPRMNHPALMLNGKYDDTFPVEINIELLFKSLGTPEKDKRLKMFETGHCVWTSNKWIKEALDFLDIYLGTVNEGKHL